MRRAKDVMGISEIAELLGCSRQYAGTLSSQKRFPDPIARLAMGPLWDAKDVRAWAEKTGRAMNGTTK